MKSGNIDVNMCHKFCCIVCSCFYMYTFLYIFGVDMFTLIYLIFIPGMMFCYPVFQLSYDGNQNYQDIAYDGESRPVLFLFGWFTQFLALTSIRPLNGSQSIFIFFIFFFILHSFQHWLGLIRCNHRGQSMLELESTSHLIWLLPSTGPDKLACMSWTW